MSDALRPLNDTAVQILVQNHRYFRKFLEKRVKQVEVAEDLLQLSLRKAIENPSESTQDQNVLAWFYQILRNTLIDYYRTNASEARKHEGWLQDLETQGAVAHRSVEDIETGICECIEGLLPTLHENYAQLIRKVDLGGAPIAQVASELGITEGNLNVRLHRARHALKVSLERACGSCTEHGCLNCTCE